MIDIKNLSLDIGEFSLRDISLTIGNKEYFIILGPTGAGKTILIECLAGLYSLGKGEIHIDGNEVSSLPPEKRNIGYVPQDFALFPFLSVADNINFGLSGKRGQQSQRNDTVSNLTQLLGIAHLLNRDVRTLSGGEKQRVALARALATNPKLLLLDEPLNTVDVRTAKYLRLELKRLHEELGLTTIHVTHNLMEAEEMAERMAILNMGRVEQIGTSDEVFFYPNSETVSDLIGTPNILICDSCNVLGHGLVEAVCGGVPVILPYHGDTIRRIALFPRDIYVSTSKPPGPELNRFTGRITEIIPFSSLIRLRVEVGDNNLVAELPRDLFEDMDISIGQEVFLILKLRRLRVH